MRLKVVSVGSRVDPGKWVYLYNMKQQDKHAIKMISLSLAIIVGGWFTLINVIYPALHYIAPTVFTYS